MGKRVRYGEIIQVIRDKHNYTYKITLTLGIAFYIPFRHRLQRHLYNLKKNRSLTTLHTIYFHVYKVLDHFIKRIQAMFQTSCSLFYLFQLKHVFTNKFVHMCTSQTSQIDKNNMVVRMSSHLLTSLFK